MSARRINFLIAHGTLGNPNGNWYPWLKQRLEKDGHTVVVPCFPTPEGQRLDAWAKIANDAITDFDPANSILIGHSMGAGLVLTMAENKPCKAVFAVCPFLCDLSIEPYDTLNKSFTHRVYDWARIRRNAANIVCLAGDDDPYVPLPYSRDVANQAGGELLVVNKGGHLNAESGYLAFPLLLDKIRQII